MNINLFQGQRILITGASGLIGYNFCKLLQNIDSLVHINYHQDLQYPFTMVLNNKFKHEQFDICDIEQIKQLPKFDYIFHLAGYGQPKKFLENREKTFKLNTESLLALCDKLKNNGKILFAGTSEIYAISTTTKEEDLVTVDHLNPRACYILGKLYGESLLNLVDGLNYKVARICLAYGPGFKINDNRVLNELIFKALKSKKIDLLDDGSAIRQYIYIDDAINMMLNILNSGKDKVYNVGGVEKKSILDIAKIIATQTGANLKIGENKNKLSGSPNFAGVDITKYENEFGKVNFLDLKSGIKRAISWAQFL